MQETNDFKISADLDEESYKKLIRIAKENDRPVAAQLRVMIKEYEA